MAHTFTRIPDAPTRTGFAEQDGLLALQYTIAHNLTPADPELVALALHVSPLAYRGADDLTVRAVNKAVDLLARAKQRHTAAEREIAQLAEIRKRLAERQGPADLNGGHLVAPVPPPPTLPPHAGTVDVLIAEYAQKQHISPDVARAQLARLAQQRRATQQPVGGVQ